MVKSPTEWTEADLISLVRSGAQESLELEFKGSDSLKNTDGNKKEISKDVSAMANSAGGVIIYGIKENGKVATGLDLGVDPQGISKEWLEQVINSTIQRRIPGLRINAIELTSQSPGRYAFVVVIPQSDRAPHQAQDKRFYKRYNFQAIPMEEYEIRDVSNRFVYPRLYLSPELATWVLGGKGGFELDFRIGNDSAQPAFSALFDVYIDARLTVVHAELKDMGTDHLTWDQASHDVKRYQKGWGPTDIPIFEGTNFTTGKLRIQVPEGDETYVVAWKCRAPGFMGPVRLMRVQWVGDKIMGIV